jgi:exopolysaccharide/PEP-CTERM locus tyrosine autokinase
MSLIERALNKARDGTQAVAGGGGLRVGAEPVAQVGATAGAAAVPLREPAPRRVDAPELAVTDTVLDAAGLLAPHDQQRQVTSEYRHIKRRLLAEIQAGSANRMTLIASALPGEGKSFSSANLAFSLALEPDFTVVLVDADVIKPNLTRVFGLLNRPGLMDAAADRSVDVESLIVSTNIEGLSILPAGRTDANATEYFASSRMQEIVNELLAVPNRLLVVDSLPLLLTTESRALVPLAGQVVLVVRAESTPQQAVLQAVDLLGEDANVKVVLNAMVRTKAQAYMGYGYYGYNYNYGEGAEPERQGGKNA